MGIRHIVVSHGYVHLRLPVYLSRQMLPVFLQPNNMDQIVSDCCGLTFVDEEENTLHYVHHSVKQHLFATKGPHSTEFNLVNVDQHLGFLCMTYLDFIDFKRQLAKVKDASSVAIMPVQLGVLPVIRSSNLPNRIALDLLARFRQLRNLSPDELEKKTHEIMGDMEAADEADSITVAAMPEEPIQPPNEGSQAARRQPRHGSRVPTGIFAL